MRRVVLLVSFLTVLAGQAAAATPATLTELRTRDFRVVAADGRTVPLSDLLPEGKPAVVELWATWCAPCRKTMPELVRLHAAYAGRGLVIVGLTVEEPARDAEKVNAFIRSNGVTYPIAFATPEIFRVITGRETVAVPKIVVYDSAGAIAEYAITYSPFTNRRIARAVERVMSQR